jgi:hypothetical protein
MKDEGRAKAAQSRLQARHEPSASRRRATEKSVFGFLARRQEHFHRKGVLPRSLAGLVVGRGVPNLSPKVVRFGTFRAPLDVRGAVGSPRPTNWRVGHYARKRAAIEGHGSTALHHARLRPHETRFPWTLPPAPAVSWDSPRR